jgi:G3E family GTPase
LLAGKQKEARAILDKIAPVMASIESLEGVQEFSMLAVPLREPLSAKKLFLEQVAAAAHIIMASVDATDLPEMASLREVLDTIANAKKVIALITGVLAAIARAHR